MMTQHDPDRHHRRSIRLPGYDYHAPGAYFVTLCTRDRECVLDDFVVTGIISDVWRSLPGWFPAITLDEFVVMPNHVHLIVWLHSSDDGAGASPAPTQTDAGGGVGATLAVAPDTAAPNAVTPDSANRHAAASDILPPHRAGASPAPTQTNADDDVGATLAVAPYAAAPHAVVPGAVAPNAVDPHRAGASPAPTRTDANDGVGATLAVAPDTAAPNAVTPDSANRHAAASDILPPHRAGASPAPTQTNADDDVGATLAVAPYAAAPHAVVPGAVAPNAVDPHRAGASPAPTRTDANDGVGATLAVAPDTVTLDSVAPWIIPAPERINPNPTLGDVIGAFKSLVFTVYLDWIQANDPTRQAKFWQRNYYEHIIRNERELHAIRRYIRDNPAQWALDRDNPLNFRHMSPPRRVEDYLADIQALLEDGDGE